MTETTAPEGRGMRIVRSSVVVIGILVGLLLFSIVWPQWGLGLLLRVFGERLGEGGPCDCPRLEQLVESIDWTGTGQGLDLTQQSANGWLHLSDYARSPSPSPSQQRNAVIHQRLVEAGAEVASAEILEDEQDALRDRGFRGVLLAEPVHDPAWVVGLSDAQYLSVWVRPPEEARDARLQRLTEGLGTITSRPLLQLSDATATLLGSLVICVVALLLFRRTQGRGRSVFGLWAAEAGAVVITVLLTIGFDAAVRREQQPEAPCDCPELLAAVVSTRWTPEPVRDWRVSASGKVRNRPQYAIVASPLSTDPAGDAERVREALRSAGWHGSGYHFATLSQTSIGISTSASDNLLHVSIQASDATAAAREITALQTYLRPSP